MQNDYLSGIYESTTISCTFECTFNSHTVDVQAQFFLSESVHADFKKVWQHFKISIRNPNHGMWLCRALVRYNSRHLRILPQV